MKKYFYTIFLFLISFIYFYLRFNHLSENFVFRPDQGLHLLESYEMVQNHKIRLLGPYVSSKSYDNRNFFIGPYYYYALATLGIMTNWNPLGMTLLYGVIEFCFIILFIFWLKKKFNPPISLIIFTFLALFPYLISHSRFYWNPHFLLPLGVLEIYFLDKYIVSKKKFSLFLSAFIWGFAFSFHYAAILWGIVYLYIFIKNKLFSRFYSYPLAIFGFIFGDILFFISEFKHNFYNFRTIIFVYSNAKENSQLFGHYFIYPFIIFILFLIAYFLHKYWLNIKLRLLFIIILLSLAIFIPPVDELSSISGWRFPDQKLAQKLILGETCPINYNLASTMSGDTQSFDLRSLLTISHCPPNSIEAYPQSQTIFLIAPPSRPPETEKVWEIDSFHPFTVSEQKKINDHLIFYRLDKSADNP